jgi:hypothetical protein
VVLVWSRNELGGSEGHSYFLLLPGFKACSVIMVLPDRIELSTPLPKESSLPRPATERSCNAITEAKSTATHGSVMWSASTACGALTESSRLARRESNVEEWCLCDRGCARDEKGCNAYHSSRVPPGPAFGASFCAGRRRRDIGSLPDSAAHLGRAAHQLPSNEQTL